MYFTCPEVLYTLYNPKGIRRIAVLYRYKDTLLPLWHLVGTEKELYCTCTDALYKLYRTLGEKSFSCAVQALWLCTGRTAHRSVDVKL